MIELVGVYNVVLLGFDVIAWTAVSRYRHFSVYLSVVAGSAAAAFAVAVLLGQFTFLAVHLLAYGCFLHLPVVILSCGWLLRDTHRHWSRVGTLVGLAIVLVAIDAFWIEPTWLQVERVVLRSNEVRRPWRIALMADLQTDRLSDYERSVFQQVRAAKPDLILMAGDYLQSAHMDSTHLLQQYREYLQSIEFGAPFGVFVVGGNNDEGPWQDMFEGVPVHLFDNTSTCVVEGQLSITGLTLLDSFDSQLAVPSRPGFHIVLGHGPDFALSTHIDADLLLAGHTHGGQVRLPGIGPLITLSSIPRDWAAGLTKLPSGNTLIVSRGIGHERGVAPRLRFLCRPQVVIIDLLPDS